MTEQRLYTRAELVDLCGVDEDALVFWLRKDLLKSVVTESRKHKRFPLSELRLARVLVCLRKFGVNVRHMDAVLQFLRMLDNMGRELPTKARLGDVLAALEDGADRASFSELLDKWGSAPDEARDILQSYDMIAAEGTAEAWSVYLAFDDRLPLGVVVSDQDSAWMRFVTSIEQCEFDGMLVLDLKRLFAGLEE